MNTNKLTQKSAEVLQNAQSVAVSYSNQTLQPEHLLLSLLTGQDSLNGQLFTKMGIDVNNFCDDLKRKIEVGKQYTSAICAYPQNNKLSFELFDGTLTVHFTQKNQARFFELKK